MINITSHRKWFTNHVADCRLKSQIPAIYVDWYEKHSFFKCLREYYKCLRFFISENKYKVCFEGIKYD